MSDSEFWMATPKTERLMATLKVVMKDGSFSRRSSRERSRNRSRNKRKGSKKPRNRTRDQTPAKHEKKTKTYTRPPILRATPTNNEWQCANCGQTKWMTRKERRHCHKMPQFPPTLGPSKKRPRDPRAIPTPLGRTSPRANRTKGPTRVHIKQTKARPIRRSMSRMGTRTLKTPKWPITKEPS